MRRILSFCALLLLTSVTVCWGQNAPSGDTRISCTQRLRLARATYEAGRLHELVGTILGPEASACFGLDVGAFSKQEKVDALKLLTLAYIYLEEPQQADESMLRLLQTDHFYTPDPNSDPAEYLALYNTFRTHPIISFGAKVGASGTFAHLIQNYVVGGQAPAKGRYLPGVSVVGGLFVEKELFVNSKSFLKNTTTLAEVFVHLRPNKIVSDELHTNPFTDPDDPDASPATTTEFAAKSSWIDLNLIMRYRLNPKSQFDPYIGLGPGFSYLLASNWTPQTQVLTNTGVISATVTGTDVDTKNAYKSLTNTATAMGGFRIRLGEFYFNVEARYQFGLFNLIDPENRTVSALVYDYQTTINDYRQSNFILNIGATIPKFIPKKKKKK